jgi:hypothetical protein
MRAQAFGTRPACRGMAKRSHLCLGYFVLTLKFSENEARGLELFYIDPNLFTQSEEPRGIPFVVGAIDFAHPRFEFESELL